MEIVESLEPFKGHTYNEEALLEHLRNRKYSDFECSQLDSGELRILMKLYKEDRTLFVRLDEDKKVLNFIFISSKVNHYMASTPVTIGCLVGLAIAIGLFIWFLVWIFTPDDSYDYDEPVESDPGRGANFDHNQDGQLNSDEIEDWYEYKTTNDDDGDF